jgi:hypothetical protein
MPERPDGFYCVRFHGGWQVAELVTHGDGQIWLFPGVENDQTPDEIGERLERGLPRIRVDQPVPLSTVNDRIEAAVAAEREACAKVAEEMAHSSSGSDGDPYDNGVINTAERIAEKIRERK